MNEIRTGCNDSCPYYMSNTGCFKPEGIYCPPMSTTVYQVPQDKNEELWGVMVKEDGVSACVRRCIICGNNIKFVKNSDEIICSECKEAIKKLKEWLENDK